MNKGGSGDELWDEFVREFEKNNAQHEASAAERAQQQQQQQQPSPPQGRRSRGRVLVPLAVALLVAAGAGAYALRPTRSEPTAAPAPSAPASRSASPSAPAPPAAAASASTAASALAGSVPSDEPTSAAPLSVFPEQVQGYTLVAKTTKPVCTGADTVAPTLAGLITQGKGCLGVDLALYKDADGNQYNLVLFTMKDQREAMELGLSLGSRTDDYQVAVQLPPPGSGLRELPADSGLVQSVTGLGHSLMVSMGQWSDGHSGDFNTLVQKLTPLTKAVSHNFPEWVDGMEAGQDSGTA
ncbi:hypothetical protein Kpho02_32190 [Kitasatospora phosalacinea]|uniref:Uncharacterized protein n=1 Tax=Kitasatospora phosalacinea TaxID=2065 RepID=A0A9W6Q633_9ACTN|nr:hypothetical protein [Kitasatospora phosalacinea]GLW70920.1 hypothetical protein Kpho02_32190 [Kitasatospora phosalacinea]